MRLHRKSRWIRTGHPAVRAGSLVAIVLMVIAGSAWASRTRPNIVFILADDLGYGDLGCYGQQVIQTPRLDALAKQGMRFTSCYAGSTVCAPSRCCLMTGLHTGHCRIRGNKRVPLQSDDVTVAELLQRTGYKTGLFGKWGLGDAGTTGAPDQKGFRAFFGYLDQHHAHNYYPDFLWDGTVKFPLAGNVALGGVATSKAIYAPDIIMQRALEFVRENQGEPFFLYLAVTAPHANNEAGALRGDGMEVPDYDSYADRDWPNPEKGRAAMITRLDRDVGQLLDLLDELGLSEQTIVFFTSDNGPHSEGNSSADYFHSSGPLRGKKRDLYEGGIRVPMLVRWPNRITAGAESDFPWAFWDVLPTFCELTQVPVPQGLDGISVVSALRGMAPESRPELYWEFHERGFSQAARIGDWKAVRPRGGELQLFDLSNDIGETHDIAAEHPQWVDRFERYFTAARTESEHWPVAAATRKQK